jgi:predicted nucleotidyltransferase
LIKTLVDLNKMDALSFDIDKLIEICRENDAAMVGAFGSVARGEDTLASDIDLMVKLSRRKSLLDIVKLERELSTVFGRKVDLLTEAAISPYLKDRILSELKVIYEN